MPTSSAEGTHSSALLRVTQLSAGYSATPTIHDVTVGVAAGEIAAVVGPNGAGKSTLLKAIMGVIDVTAGTVHIGDEDITHLSGDQIARRGIGYVPQVKDCFDPLTVTENLEMGGYTLPKGELAGRIEEVMEAFPALATMRQRRAGNLSGGERKMVAMGRVLMLRPRLLVLDEPTAGLSPKLSRALLEEQVTGLASTGVGVLLVEQKAVEALSISRWAFVMASGTVRISAAASDLLARKDIGEVFLGRALDPVP